jgi:hypothetical protein
MRIAWPKSKVLMIAAWVSDALWLAMMAWSPFFGFAISCFIAVNIFQLFMFSFYRKRKIAGRYTNLEPRRWVDQVW